MAKNTDLSTEPLRPSANDNGEGKPQGLSSSVQVSSTPKYATEITGDTPTEKTQKPLKCVNTTYDARDERNQYITYVANKIPSQDRLDILATWQHEADWQPTSKSKINGNGSRDYGICQLNNTYHAQFINSSEFQDPYKQLDYCIEVYENAKDRGVPIGKVWYGFASREKHKYKFNCQ